MGKLHTQLSLRTFETMLINNGRPQIMTHFETSLKIIDSVRTICGPVLKPSIAGLYSSTVEGLLVSQCIWNEFNLSSRHNQTTLRRRTAAP